MITDNWNLFDLILCFLFNRCFVVSPVSCWLDQMLILKFLFLNHVWTLKCLTSISFSNYLLSLIIYSQYLVTRVFILAPQSFLLDSKFNFPICEVHPLVVLSVRVSSNSLDFWKCPHSGMMVHPDIEFMCSCRHQRYYSIVFWHLLLMMRSLKVVWY